MLGGRYELPLLTERTGAIVLPRRAPHDRLVVSPSGDSDPYPRIMGPSVPIVHRLRIMGPSALIALRLLIVGSHVPIVHRLLAIGAQSLVGRCTRAAGSMVDP